MISRIYTNNIDLLILMQVETEIIAGVSVLIVVSVIGISEILISINATATITQTIFFGRVL